MVESNGDCDAGVDAFAGIVSSALPVIPFSERRQFGDGWIVALENRFSGECGDSDQLSGSADTSGRSERDRERYPTLKYPVLDAAVSFSVLLRIHVRRRRKVNRRTWNSAGAYCDHDLLVPSMREPCTCFEFRDACGKQVSAGHGRGRRLSSGDQSGGGVVSYAG